MGWKVTVLCSGALLAVLVFHHSAAKPLKRGPPQPDPVEAGSPKDEELGTGLEYDGYLRQVVETLESDEEFRKRLEAANISDIKSGAIAMHLELVNHSIRNRLDEIKRMEVRRLQELALIRMKSMSGTQVLHFIAAHGGVGVNRMDIPTHLDLKNPHSFEMKDLEHLIKQATDDLEEVDRRRKEEFKNYEMEKELDFQEKLKDLPDEEKTKRMEKHKDLQEKHKEHPKINHPGSKDQFEEVWEKEDHLEDQDFDPKTFFMMHDLNGDRMWDIQEVEAVLQRELDKVYDARNTAEEDDPNERFEEMSRMREHVFTEIDANKDFMITIDEFMDYTGKTGDNDKFKEDEGWETLDENPQFSDDEFEEFMKKKHPDQLPDFEEYMRQKHPERFIPKQPESLQFVPEGQGHGQLPQQGILQQPGQPMGHQPQFQGQPVQGHQQGQFQQGQGQFQQGQGQFQQGQGQFQQGQGQFQQGQGHFQAGQAGQPQQGQPMPPQPQGQGPAGQGLPQPVQGQGQPVHGQPAHAQPPQV